MTLDFCRWTSVPDFRRQDHPSSCPRFVWKRVAAGKQWPGAECGNKQDRGERVECFFNAPLVCNFSLHSDVTCTRHSWGQLKWCQATWRVASNLNPRSRSFVGAQTLHCLKILPGCQQAFFANLGVKKIGMKLLCLWKKLSV